MNRLWIVLGLMTAVSCFAGGYWLADRKEPVQRTVYQDRVVVQHSEKHDDISTVTVRKVTKPSGEVIETNTTKIDKSVAKGSQVAQERSLEVTKSVTYRPDWRISVFMPPRYPASYSEMSIEVSRRILGPVSMGVQVSGRGNVLVGVGVEF